jgi:hypothetical protein
MILKRFAISLLAVLMFSCTLMTAVSATVWSPSLPTKAVTIEIVNLTPMEMPYSVQLSDVGSGFDVVAGVYASWCVDIQHLTDRGVKYSYMLYSSYDGAAPLPAEEWDMINYLLNNKLGTGADVQAAIWYFINDRDYYWPSLPFAPSNETEIMVTNALANGEGYRPSEGELFAVVGIPVDATRVQTIVIEVVVPNQVGPELTPTPTSNPEPTPGSEPEPETELILAPTPTPTSSVEAFPITLIVAIIVIVIVAGIGVITYFKERTRGRTKTIREYFQNW